MIALDRIHANVFFFLGLSLAACHPTFLVASRTQRNEVIAVRIHFSTSQDAILREAKANTRRTFIVEAAEVPAAMHTFSCKHGREMGDRCFDFMKDGFFKLLKTHDVQR